MAPKYTYLIIDGAAVALPLLFSFWPKANFSSKWRSALPALIITAAVFILWDIAFTRLGIWTFNPAYITGAYVLDLPVEEVLFFICIPYACVFTYFALQHLVAEDYLLPYQDFITGSLVAGLSIAGLYFLDREYTAATFLLTAIFLALVMLKLRPAYLGRFYFTFLILLVPFFLIDGVLTGTFTDEPVVQYNSGAIMGVRIGTVPPEDLFYAMLLILVNVILYEELEARRKRKKSS